MGATPTIGIAGKRNLRVCRTDDPSFRRRLWHFKVEAHYFVPETQIVWIYIFGIRLKGPQCVFLLHH